MVITDKISFFYLLFKVKRKINLIPCMNSYSFRIWTVSVKIFCGNEIKSIFYDHRSIAKIIGSFKLMNKRLVSGV